MFQPHWSYAPVFRGIPGCMRSWFCRRYRAHPSTGVLVRSIRDPQSPDFGVFHREQSFLYGLQRRNAVSARDSSKECTEKAASNVGCAPEDSDPRGGPALTDVGLSEVVAQRDRQAEVLVCCIANVLKVIPRRRRTRLQDLCAASCASWEEDFDERRSGSHRWARVIIITIALTQVNCESES